MATLDWKVMNSKGELIAAFHEPVSAVVHSRRFRGKIKNGAWIVWNWAKENPLPGTSEKAIVHTMRQRIREKHIASLRKQGLPDDKIRSLMGDAAGGQ